MLSEFEFNNLHSIVRLLCVLNTAQFHSVNYKLKRRKKRDEVHSIRKNKRYSSTKHSKFTIETEIGRIRENKLGRDNDGSNTVASHTHTKSINFACSIMFCVYVCVSGFWNSIGRMEWWRPCDRTRTRSPCAFMLSMRAIRISICQLAWEMKFEKIATTIN